jgi:hypothetical protein
MSHDKIRDAARKRMAETGEPYAAARREVIREYQAAGRQMPPTGPEWFEISYGPTWSGRLSGWLDSVLFRAGPGVSGVEVGSSQIRVRMGSFKLDIPRGSVRPVKRSEARVGGTIGVHGSRGRWLVNGSADGLVEIAVDPPCYLAPGIDTLFRREKVSSLTPEPRRPRRLHCGVGSTLEALPPRKFARISGGWLAVRPG